MLPLLVTHGIPSDKLGYTRSRDCGFAYWANPANVILTGDPVQVPAPKKFPRDGNDSGSSQLVSDEAQGPSPRGSAVPEESAGTPKAAEQADPGTWTSFADFEKSKVRQQWIQVLKDGQKLRDK